MLELIHLPLSPFCRKVRLALGEKKIDARLVVASPWAMGDAIYDLNPAGTLPVLLEGELPIPDSVAITEYLDEAYSHPPLLPGHALTRAETRRLVAWFDGKFYEEVSGPVLHEKLYKRLMRDAAPAPDMPRIRAGLANLKVHLDYIGYLAGQRNWLAGDELSLADFAAAAHLSCLDYIGDVPWADFPEAQSWYARIKSRPAFRPILADRIPGMLPSSHYSDLDF